MKRFRLLYYIFLSSLFMLTACQTDMADGTAPTDKGIVKVKINVSPAAPTSTMRAWQDDNADGDEMMNIWTVVITDASGNVKDILSCKPTGDPDREIDEVTELEAGTYKFYSFANIGAEKLEELLEFSNGTILVPSNENDVISNKPSGLIFPASGKTLDSYTATVNGNQFDITSTDNGYGSQGIPMSNVQEITINSSNTTQEIDLIVVRMLAKMELQVYNDSRSDVTIESVTLTDITKNAENNLKLFPNYKTASSANKMEAVHGDIQPNLNGTPGTENLTITPSVKTISATANSYSDSKDPVKITFYVNESTTPKGQNWGSITTQDFSHFFLRIKFDGKDEERYVLIDDSNKESKDTGKWDYIARNDYRIIPIVLDDYKLDIIPYDFPAIGVHPISVKEEDGIYTVNFHDGGHFHLVPQVTKYSNGDVVNFTATTPTTTPYTSTSWGLVNNSFDDSWGSWTDATKATVYSGDFYRTENTDTVDGDEAGGAPTWYANSSAPQWSPKGDGKYPPFIFGYIADPEEKLTTDRKVYHEFSINLYKQGTGAARQMTYRLYMIFDTDQMLSRSNVAAPVRHTHGH